MHCYILRKEISTRPFQLVPCRKVATNNNNNEEKRLLGCSKYFEAYKKTFPKPTGRTWKGTAFGGFKSKPQIPELLER